MNRQHLHFIMRDCNAKDGPVEMYVGRYRLGTQNVCEEEAIQFSEEQEFVITSYLSDHQRNFTYRNPHKMILIKL